MSGFYLLNRTRSLLIYPYSVFNPDKVYSRSEFREFGKDIAQSVLGIYYYDSVRKYRVPEGRNLFLPSIANVDWDNEEETVRRQRARDVEKHNISNETSPLSEFGWERDAWIGVFNLMRNDNQLAGSVFECYQNLLPKT